MSEFNLIAQYFTRSAPNADLGVGDDAALVRVKEGHQLAISADMLVAGIHFFHDAAPYDIGWKSLAVNISDMAAMGATPKWATLAIALPDVNEAWLAEFSRGFFDCAVKFHVDLIGGDTTRGSLTISVQIMGEVPIGKAIKRSGAKVGDEIWVSGKLGDAALALAHLQNKLILPDDVLLQCEAALHSPQPRVSLGLALRDIANSAIDVSDGLLADLGHILKCSNAGAILQLADIPRTQLDESVYGHEKQIYLALAGGDDYELCFTAPADKHTEILQIGEKLALPLSCIGRVTQSAGVIVHDKIGEILEIKKTGYNHFA
ncbi:MAG: thiamine-phosphate kinase [Methylotenera sp.]|nr:thiamine-phosphate kinase [Methylotenera sp.]